MLHLTSTLKLEVLRLNETLVTTKTACLHNPRDHNQRVVIVRRKGTEMAGAIQRPSK